MPHRGFAAFLAARGIQAAEERPDGAFVLVSDERHRVYVHPAPRGELALESQIVELPADTRRADELIERAMDFAGERLSDWREAVVLTADERQLQLQWRIGADEGVPGVAEALEEFLNALGDWRRAMGEL
jgi:hypothetical protein